MTKTLAAGLIIYRKISNQISYLLLESTYAQSHWTPPKGHLDEGENGLEAAIRETREEAGLESDKDYKIISKEFNIESNYLVLNKPKQVVYWLAKANDDVTVKLSDEHQAFKWYEIDEACKIVGFEEMARVIRLAHDFILKN